MPLVLRPPDSRESLTDTLADIGRSRRLVGVAAGVFAFAAVGLGSVLVACLLDAAVHLSPLSRAFALAFSLAAAGVVWLRGVVGPLGLRTDALSIALELEEKFPRLNDSLASAVSFLESEDAEGRGVSSWLQQVAVKAARRAAERHSLDSLVPSGACWRAAAACAFVLAFFVPLVLANVERTGVAMARLADPFGHHPWPTKTRVDVVLPAEFPVRMPKGEAFDLKFVVRGAIKDRATVTFRMDSGEEFEEQYPLASGNDSKYPGAAVVTTRIEAARVHTSFVLRIASNDFASDWQRVNVVPPPRLVPLAGPGGGRPSPHFHVAPPAYTGLPAIDLPDGATAIEVPVGSVVSMRAATDVRLSSAVLAYTGELASVTDAAGLAPVGNLNPLTAIGMQALADDIGAPIPVAIDGTGRHLSAVFAPSVSGMYALKLKDETGLTGTRLLEIRLVPDPTPTVTLLRPSPGRDPQFLTPNARLTLHVAADDKVYAVRRTFLEYRAGRDDTIRSIPLRDARESAPTLTAVVGGPGALARVRPLSTEAKVVLQLSAFTRDGTNPLQLGDSLVIRGAADDWDDVTPAKEPGRSKEFEIRIASPESVEAWLERELAALRPDLIRARDQQREARQKAAEVQPQSDGSLVPADRDRLLASEQSQRLIRGKVSDANDGLRAKADVLLETVRVNDLPRSNTTDRVAVVAEVLGRLSERDLPVIEPTLSDARQFGSRPPPAGGEQLVPDLLKRGTRHQKAVEDGLTDVLDLLAVWGGAVEIRGEARVLREFIRQQAAELNNLGNPAPTGDLDRAGTRAEQAADQANQLLARAGKLANKKDEEAVATRGKAADKAAEAAALRAKAAELLPGTPEKSTMNAQAALLEGEAADARSSAERAAAEANSLRKGVQAAEGQALPDGLRGAAGAIRKDNRDTGSEQLRTASGRLDRLIEALTEKPDEEAPDLKKLKKSADDVDTLAAAQDDLRNRAAEAAKITDPAKRAAALKKLAGEQERLLERGRELLQRLTRERADRPAREVRAALDAMETARNDLENGNPGIRPQNEAVERLDNARDRLDAAAVAVPEQLSDEKRRKIADKVNALLERQKAAVVEAQRIHGVVATEKKWNNDMLTAYGDVALVREEPLAKEVRELEKDFAPLPVLARVVSEAARAMDKAVENVIGRVKDTDTALAFDAELELAADRKVLRPMALAQRRLEQLLDALKQDDPKAKSAKESREPAPKNPASPPQGGNRDRDLVPPLAQLKVLRSLQAELNGRTAEFAKLHPDPEKLTDEERAELKELEDAQRDVAALFEEMAKLFREQKQLPPDAPEKVENPAPEKP